MRVNPQIAGLITTYHELNANIVDELHEEPSPLEFMRYVAKNRPFVVRGGAASWKACRAWNAAYLHQAMSGETVNVAITPLGNADAVVEHEFGKLVMVQPHEANEPFDEFLSYVQHDSATADDRSNKRNVKYAQTQNDNLREEYSLLFADVPSDVPFARIALGQPADAMNFWLGNERSVTALHNDNYENIYVQVIGQKHFVLLPPVEMACVHERMIRQARYVPSSEDGAELLVKLDEAGDLLPTPTWDPDESDSRTSAYSHLSRPLRVTLNAGDMLFLPAMWYHKVSQSSGKEGFACAVNYWYDMSFEGSFWAGNNFIRDLVFAKEKEVDYPELDCHDGNSIG